MSTILHRSRDAKIFLVLVVLALLIAVVVLSLTGHHVPAELNAAMIAAVGSLGGVSLPAGTLADVQSAESGLSRAVPADDLAALRHDVNGLMEFTQTRAGKVEVDALRQWLAGRDTSTPAAPAVAVPLPDAAPAS